MVTGRRGDDGEADEENVGLRVGERTKTIVIFLTGCIPETKVDGLAVDHHVCAVVIENGGDVLTGESVGCERDKKARLTDSTITNNDTLDCLHFIIILL